MSVTTTTVIDPTSGGYIAVNTEIGIAYPLTTCCQATGKGAGYGVVCRSCYAEVDWAFGDGWIISEMPEDIRAQVMAEVSA